MKPENIGRKDLKQFGLVFALILSFFAFTQFRKGNVTLSMWFAMFAGLMSITGVLSPILLTPVFKVFTKIAHALGWFNTRLILALAYYFVITPIGLVLRIARKDLLSLKIDKNAPTYWLDHHSGGVTAKSLENQF
jgi:hypothetical protein